jgi:predicted nucleotidyltransferase
MSSRRPIDNPVICQIMQTAVDVSQKAFGDNLRQVWLYGSYARGDWDEDSDIDCMIVVSEPVEEWKYLHTVYCDFTMDAVNRFGELPSVLITYSDEFNVEKIPLYDSVRKEGVLFYGN